MESKGIVIYRLLLIAVAVWALGACRDEYGPDSFEPQLYVGAATDITRTEVTLTGRVVRQGNTPMPQLRFLYGTSQGPDLASPVVEADGEGSVSVRLTGLEPGTFYSFCLQGDNGRVVLSSDTAAFTTLPAEIPVLYVDTVADVTRMEATLTGGVRKEAETAMPEGLRFVYGTQQDDTMGLAMPVPEVDSTGHVSVRLTGLEPGTSYRFCLQGDNGSVVLSSDTVTFTTLPEDIPVLYVDAVADVTRKEATLTGGVRKEAETAMPEGLRFVYGAQQEGTMSLAVPVPEADSAGHVSVRLTGLDPGTSYRFCLQGDNGSVVLSSDTVVFTTLPERLPVVGPPSLLGVGPLSAVLTYEITDEGTERVTESGCYVSNLATGRTVKHQVSSVSSVCRLHISGLESGLAYSIQPYAVSSVGEARGEKLEITTADAFVWTEPGGLDELAGEEDLFQFTSLTFAGPMNGDDLRQLRRLAGREPDGTDSGGRLTRLDLTDADIVSGGGSYDNAHYAADNVVGQGLFAGCDRLEEVVLPASVRVIEKDAFLDCSSLVRLDIPAGAVQVAPSDGCSQLAGIGVSELNAAYFSEDGVLFTADLSELVWFPMGRDGDYVLPSSVTLVGDYAFRGSRVTKLTLPDGLKSLGQGVFYGSRVEEVVMPASLGTLPAATFQGCGSLRTVRLGSGTGLVSDYAFDGCPLEHLYVEAVYPPVCNSHAFTTSYEGLFAGCVLHVPQQALEMYRAHPSWGKFEHIVGM